MITMMGFTRAQAIKALKATDNNIERAADWLFSHQAELDADDSEDQAAASEPKFRDGNSSKYYIIMSLKYRAPSLPFFLNNVNLIYDKLFFLNS